MQGLIPLNVGSRDVIRIHISFEAFKLSLFVDD